jgi:hypothetical protein
MSRSKSRWKAALLATVATAVVSPIAAKASMTFSLSLSPMGSSGPFTSEYIDPVDPVSIYVYATVTGTSSPSTAEVDGLEYLYYNVNAAVSSGVTGLGGITNATLSPLFGGGSFNNGNGLAGNGTGVLINGSQTGQVSSSAYTTTPSVAVGDIGNAGNMLYMAKPRAASDVFVSGANASSQVYVSGNSVSFLVETLTYTPNTAAVRATPSYPTPNSVAFNASLPSMTSSYTGANYFQNLGSVPGTGQPAGTSNTSSTYVSTGTSVSLTQAIPGDASLNGTVGPEDLADVLYYFGTTDSNWTHGNFDGAATIDPQDLADILYYFNANAGGAPADLAVPAAVLDNPQAVSLLEAHGFNPVAAVPEPASLGLLGLAGAALLGRRRKAGR